MTRGGEDRWRAAGACIIVGGFLVAAALVVADKNATRRAQDAQDASIVVSEDDSRDHPLSQHPR
jgi:hypothetical protein